MVLNIKGIQKTTLLDYPDKVASSIFFGGCNLKCPACHNPGLVFNKGEIIDKKEILQDLNSRKEFIEGVCITGGEPLIADLKEFSGFIKKIKNFGLNIKIDTNGCFPDKLRNLLEKKIIDYVALDIKAPPELYSKVCGVKVNLKKMEKTIKLISDFGVDYEFRITVCPIILNKEIRWMKVEEIENMVKWVVNITGKKNHKFFLQKFVPRAGGLVDKKLEKFPETPDELMSKIKERVSKIIPDCEIRG